MSDTPELEDDLADLRGRAQLGAITRNRPVNAQGFSHGGVALFFAEDKCSFREVVVNNPSSFEVLVASGRFVGFARPVIVVGCYIPPNYSS